MISCLAILAAPLAFGQQHINQRKGFNAENTYQFLGLDNINLFNGNLTLAIPIGKRYDVAPGLSYGLQFVCNANTWDSEIAEGTVRCKPHLNCDPEALPMKALPNRRSNAGIGCTVSMGRLFPPGSVTNDGVPWIYETPDGAEHNFHATPIAGGAEDDSAIFYTRDSTFLRLRLVDAAAYVDMPDGTVHEFEADTDSLIGAWRLKKITNQFSANHISIGYASVAPVEPDYISRIWTITDSLDRHQYVKFGHQDMDGTSTPMVRKIELARFDSATPAVYDFAYTSSTIERPTWDTDQIQGGTPDLVVAPRVTAITLPDDTTFALDYLATSVDNSDAGVPTRLTLPTKGCIAWHWGVYSKPVATGSTLALQGSRGVRVRVISHRNCPSPVVNPDDTQALQTLRASSVGVWVYQPKLTPVGPVGTDVPREMTNKVTDPLGNYVINYFSVVPPSEANLGGFHGANFGLPFTSDVAAGGKFLSRETFNSAGGRLRTEYVKYEHDGPALTKSEDDPRNVRVSATRLRYDDDLSEGVKYVETTHSDYDGLGHYLTTQSSGGTFTPGLLRISKTTYAPTSPPSYVPPTPPPSFPSTLWMLNRRASTEVSEAGQTLRSEFCYDAVHGALTRSRTNESSAGSRDGNDVIAAYTTDVATGHITTETWYGGDDATVPVNNECSAMLINPTARIKYNINFTESGTNLRKSTVEYLNRATSAQLGFFTTDLTLDKNTGLVASSRDTAGVETTYDYDALGRPTHEKPVGRAWTVYDYVPASTDSSKVTARQYPTGMLTGTALTTSTFHFDDLGRLVASSQAMPGSATSEQVVTLNALGWKTFVTELGAAGTTAGTTFTYDSFGRTKTIQVADGSITEYDYVGVRKRVRKAHIATSLTGPQQIPVTESFDAFGRLVEVVEKSAGTSSTSPVGGDSSTRYWYDAADRLRVVKMGTFGMPVQERIFDYDGRGFLRWESHPESGLSSYTYDARGKVLSKTVGEAKSIFDLKYTYDDAERLKVLNSRKPGSEQFRPLKEYEYGTFNNVVGTQVDLRKGKLVKATRHNYGEDPRYVGDPNYDGPPVFKVEHVYDYIDPAGRRHGRKTTLHKIVPGPVENPPVKQDIGFAVELNDLDAVESVTYPMCNNCGAPPYTPDRQTAHLYDAGRLVRIENYVGSVQTPITYWPNGMRRALPHANGIADTQDVALMARPSEISFATYDRCVKPVLVSPVSRAIPADETMVRLSVTASGTAPFTYEWKNTVTGAIIGSNSWVDVSAGEYRVTVWNSCGSATSLKAKVTPPGCTPPSTGAIAAVLQPDRSWILRPDPVAREPKWFKWRRQLENVEVGTSQTLAVPALTASTTYTLEVGDGDECGGTATGSVTILVPLSMTNSELTATWNTVNAIVVTWPASPGATLYWIERRSGPAWVSLGSTSSTSYTDTSIVTGEERTYAYRVYADSGVSGERSEYSNTDVATTKTYSVVNAGDIVSAQVFDRMLDAVNKIRGAAGWPAVTWTNILAPSDPTVVAGNVVRARHVTSCRVRITEALLALGSRSRTYIDADLVLKEIRAIYINEILEQTR